MTITSNEAKELKKRLKRLVRAEVAVATMGQPEPGQSITLKEDLRVARKRMAEYFQILRLPDGRIKP